MIQLQSLLFDKDECRRMNITQRCWDCWIILKKDKVGWFMLPYQDRSQMNYTELPDIQNMIMLFLNLKKWIGGRGG